jgi:hypothetical protein
MAKSIRQDRRLFTGGSWYTNSARIASPIKIPPTFTSRELNMGRILSPVQFETESRRLGHD